MKAPYFGIVHNTMALQLLVAAPSMGLNKIVLLEVARELKKTKGEDPDYQDKIQRMDKLELLEEMMKFQEERAQVGHLTFKMMIQGKILFKALEENACTQELRLLARSYRRHLKFELEAHLKKQPEFLSKNRLN